MRQANRCTELGHVLDGAAVHAEGNLCISAVSSLTEWLVTSNPLLAEPCPVLRFSCEVFEVLLLIKFSGLVGEPLVLYRGFRGFSSCFVDR